MKYIRNKFLILTPLLLCGPVFGDSISVGYLSILSDSPTGGEQELTITNMTGPTDCQSVEYTACSNLDFTNWTLTVDYTSSYYSGNSFVFKDSGSSPYGGFGDITPGSTNNIFDFDLCGGAGSCADPDSPVTTITSVEFSGQISPSSFCLYDPTTNGCNAVDPTTFFANSNFDLVWNAGSPQSPYVDEDLFPYTQSPDITITDQSTPTGTPEPGTFFLLTALLPFAWLARRSKLNNRS